MKTRNGQVLTDPQIARLRTLMGSDYTGSPHTDTLVEIQAGEMIGSPFDLPDGWITGWVGTCYYGIDPEGNASRCPHWRFPTGTSDWGSREHWEEHL